VDSTRTICGRTTASSAVASMMRSRCRRSDTACRLRRSCRRARRRHHAEPFPVAASERFGRRGFAVRNNRVAQAQNGARSDPIRRQSAFDNSGFDSRRSGNKVFRSPPHDAMVAVIAASPLHFFTREIVVLRAKGRLRPGFGSTSPLGPENSRRVRVDIHAATHDFMYRSRDRFRRLVHRDVVAAVPLSWG